jgi:hypothetical protein
MDEMLGTQVMAMDDDLTLLIKCGIVHFWYRVDQLPCLQNTTEPLITYAKEHDSCTSLLTSHTLFLTFKLSHTGQFHRSTFSSPFTGKKTLWLQYQQLTNVGIDDPALVIKNTTATPKTKSSIKPNRGPISANPTEWRIDSQARTPFTSFIFFVGAFHREFFLP